MSRRLRTLLLPALAAAPFAGCTSIPPEGRARLERQLPEQSIALPPGRLSRSVIHEDDHATLQLVRALDPIPMHRHLQSEEIAYVISGTGRVTLADGELEVRAGDLFVIPRNTPHAFTPTGDAPAVLLVEYVPPFIEGDRVPEPPRP